MSILANNAKLIKVGQEYSAGSGISIDDYVISVTGEFGQTYSAGDNINIYEQDNQLYISGKDWTNDIEQASANAYEQAISQIPDPQDLSYISAKVDTNTSGIDYISSVCLTAHQDWTDTIKGASSYSYEQSTSYFDNWVEGQYTGDITNITNKITALSGDFGDYYKKTETSSKDEINDALQYVSANAGKVYEGVSPIVVNNTEDKISADTWTFSAGSNVSFVDDNVNKITRIDVDLPTPQDLSYISAQTDKANQGVDYLSGVVITALPSDMATTGDVAELAQTISETYYPNTNPSSFVNEDWVTAQGYITGVDLSEYAERAFVLSSIESATSGKLDVSSFASVSSDFLTNEDLGDYYTKSETSGADQLADAFANIPAGDVGVNTYVQTNSATINEVNTSYQTNSANFIPYTASGVELPNSNFEIGVDGQAYKLGLASGTMPLEFGEVMALFPEGALTELENGVTYTLTIQGAPDNSIIVFVNRNTQSPYTDRPTITNNQCTFTWTYEDAPVGIMEQYGNINSTSTTLTYTKNTEKRYVLEDELSSGFLQTSGLEYNAVNEISGYNGSAIAQYGAEKQWLVHDDTIVHVANSAQYALGVNLSAIAQLLGVDETVLFSGEYVASTSTSATLSEPITNFNRIKIYASRDNTRPMKCTEFLITDSNNGLFVVDNEFYNTSAIGYQDVAQLLFSENTMYCNQFFRRNLNTTGWTLSPIQLKIGRVVGIGRKQ